MNVKFDSESQALDFVLLHMVGIEAGLRELESRLIELQQVITPFLPLVSGEEAMPEQPDAATHLHSTLGCWLRDRVSPLVTEVSDLTKGPLAKKIVSPAAKPRGVG